MVERSNRVTRRRFLLWFFVVRHGLIMTKFSFESKLDRTQQHLYELNLEIKRWIKSRPYRITDELDTDTGANVICGQLLGPVPSIISQLIGDCLQNLRSSLDHLAYELAIANTGTLTFRLIGRTRGGGVT